MLDPANKGKEYPSFSFTVEAGKVREFVLAIDDPNPAFLEAGAVVPPTFSTVFTFWSGESIESYLKELGVEMFNVLHAEQEYEYHAPVHVGDTVIGQTRIADIYARTGRSGAMEFIRFDTEFRSPGGDLLLTDHALIIVRG